MLIIGGTGSIGSVIAAQALAGGWAVIVHGRTDKSVADTLAHLDKQHPGSDAKGIALDVHTGDAATKIIERAAGFYKRIDALVDCIATGPSNGGIAGAFLSTKPENYAAFLETSVVLLEQLAYAALPWLKRTGGCLVSFVSDAGVYSAPNQSIIGAARGAAIGFIRNIAVEFARDSVRAHCVSPGYVLNTRFSNQIAETNPQRLQKVQGKAGLGLPSPEDIAPLVLFLCGEQSRKITGQVISVNGGLNT